MANINETLKSLGEKLKQAGKSGVKDFAEGVKNAAIEGSEGLLRSSPELAKFFAETTLDKGALIADEMLAGAHQPREWKQLASQDESDKLFGSALAKAAAFAFLANVASVVGGVFGAAGNNVAAAVTGTLEDLLKQAK